MFLYMVRNTAMLYAKTISFQNRSPVLYAANHSSMFSAPLGFFWSLQKQMNVTEFEIMNATEITFHLSGLVLGLSHVFALWLSSALLSLTLVEN